MTKAELLRRHYEIQQAALNEIAEMIALQYGMDNQGCDLLITRIDDVAAYARQVDLFNPHNRPGDTDFIEKYDPQRDIRLQCKLSGPWVE
jgi:hypothetical protein